LKSIFGPGAYFLEVQIMKHIHTKTGSILEWQEPENFACIKYIAEGNRSFLAKDKGNVRSIAFEPEEPPRIPGRSRSNCPKQKEE